MEEEVDVQKRAVVREEVGLGKRKVQETKKVSDTVRREEARVEPVYQGKERRRRREVSYSGPERCVSLA